VTKSNDFPLGKSRTPINRGYGLCPQWRCYFLEEEGFAVCTSAKMFVGSAEWRAADNIPAT